MFRSLVKIRDMDAGVIYEREMNVPEGNAIGAALLALKSKRSEGLATNRLIVEVLPIGE